MYYIGYLSYDTKHMIVFKSIKTPRKSDLTYFIKVIGPYNTEFEANRALRRVKNRKKSHRMGVHYNGHNPVSGYRSSEWESVQLTNKLMRYAKKVLGEVKKNPGEEYHNREFLRFLTELEKYRIGSKPYIETLAKAYEHLKSAEASMKERV